jgi:hypothetical protein
MWSFEVVSWLFLWEKLKLKFCNNNTNNNKESGGCVKQEMFWGNVGAKNKKNYL